MTMEPKLSSIEGGNFAEFWLLVDKFYHAKYYSDNYPDHLTKFLQSLGGSEILDVACGIGFPAMLLADKDINLTCADGNPSMVEVFRARAKERNISFPIIHSKWIELPQRLDRQFDVVLCLDSSITHVNSWGDPNPIDIEQAKEMILRSLRAFYDMLTPGGHVVVGLSKYAGDVDTEFITDFGTLEIEGVPVHHEWRIKCDKPTKTKVWTLITEYQDRKNMKEFQSYWLEPEELRQTLIDAGFRNVQIKEIQQGEYDDNFVAEKPASFCVV